MLDRLRISGVAAGVVALACGLLASGAAALPLTIEGLADLSYTGDSSGANATGTLVVGETGTVEADLELATLVVHGTYRGSVKAKDVVEVAPSGVVEGRVSTPRLLVAEGACINAAVEMALSR